MNEPDGERRRPGRPQSRTLEELLDRGVEVYVKDPSRLRAGLTAEAVARALKLSPSTFHDKFGLPRPDGRWGRRKPVDGFFSALRQYVLEGRASLAPEEARTFLSRAGNVLMGAGDEEIRHTLAHARTATSDRSRQYLQAAVEALGPVVADDERAAVSVDVLADARDYSPVDEQPGEGLQLELDTIDAFSTAATARWRPWLGRPGAHRIVTLEEPHHQVRLAALRAESRTRHGVVVDEVIAQAQQELPRRDSAARRNRESDAVRLAAARGIGARGELEVAISLLPTSSADPLYLVTLLSLYHLAVVQAHDDGRVKTRNRLRDRMETLETLVCEQGADASVDDLGVDEAIALTMDDVEQRLEALGKLAAEQLTSKAWRCGRTAWTLPQTIEVVADELDRTGRATAAEVLTADVLFIAQWPTPDAENSLTGDGLSLSDRDCLDRLAKRFPEAVPPSPTTEETRHFGLGVDPRVYRTSRLGGESAGLPAVTPQMLLGGLITGDVQIRRRSTIERSGQVLLDHRTADVLRQIGWLLDLREERAP